MTIGSLFAGIGGFDLAVRWMGWRTAWFSEIEPYASAVLKKHWPGVPNHGDITKIKGVDVEAVDILCGGFPCQDISGAGKGAGLKGERSGLWSHYARLIDELRPKYVVAENVSLLRSRGLDKVLGELSSLGYDAEWHCITASHVGAPHRRDRIWLTAWVSDTHGSRLEGRLYQGLSECSSEQLAWALDSSLAYTSGMYGDVSGIHGGFNQEGAYALSELGNSYTADSSRSGWLIEPAVGRVAHGVPARVDRLRCCGNAIVPEVAFRIFRAIQRREDELNGR